MMTQGSLATKEEINMKKALMLQINENLYLKGYLPKVIYEQAKIQIVQKK